MNFLDIIIIVILILLTLRALILKFMDVSEKEYGMIGGVLLVAEVKELNDSLTWWEDRYNADEKILERYRTDENGSSKDIAGNNQNS